MIARFDLGHPRPHTLNNTSPFVSEDTRRWGDGQMHVPTGQIRMANTNAGHPNQHLIIIRIT